MGGGGLESHSSVCSGSGGEVWGGGGGLESLSWVCSGSGGKDVGGGGLFPGCAVVQGAEMWWARGGGHGKINIVIFILS